MSVGCRRVSALDSRCSSCWSRQFKQLLVLQIYISKSLLKVLMLRYLNVDTYEVANRALKPINAERAKRPRRAITVVCVVSTRLLTADSCTQ